MMDAGRAGWHRLIFAHAKQGVAAVVGCVRWGGPVAVRFFVVQFALDGAFFSR